MNVSSNIPYITVFIQGLLSFFSPCVLPLLPLYIGYLSGGGTKRNEDGTLQYDRVRTLINTIFFVIGISFAFFVLGMGMSALGMFLRQKQMLFVQIGGGIIVLFGLYQLGVLGQSKVIETERRLPLRLDKLGMSPLTALLMGFVFSFAWTPCVGPTLSSVLLMAATAQTRASGMLLIGVYTLGFILPFLAVGLFATSLLAVFQKHKNIVKYTVKIGGILLILLGLMMMTGRMNSITGYLSQFTGPQIAADTAGEANAEADSGNVKDNTASDTAGEAEAGSGSEEKTGTELAEADSAETATVTETESAGSADAESATDTESTAESAADAESTAESAAEESDKETYPAPDFELYDQFGEKHTLADYKGKVIFLNFWATWCPPCRSEMPDIQKLYEKYQGAANAEESDVVILGVAFPDYGREGSEEEIAAFLSQNNYTYPTLMDTSAELAYAYGISAYPTTFMIDREGNLFGYVTGALPASMMEDIIRQTLKGGAKN